MKALVGAFNQEKALIGAFSVIVQPVVEPIEHYTALAQVHAALANIRTSGQMLRDGSLARSYAQSRDALVLAETAFFDKSLLTLLYFPDDQKYAIYIPYFLPVGFPVILSMKSLIKFAKEYRKTKTD